MKALKSAFKEEVAIRKKGNERKSVGSDLPGGTFLREVAYPV